MEAKIYLFKGILFPCPRCEGEPGKVGELKEQLEGSVTDSMYEDVRGGQVLNVGTRDRQELGLLVHVKVFEPFTNGNGKLQKEGFLMKHDLIRIVEKDH